MTVSVPIHSVVKTLTRLLSLVFFLSMFGLCPNVFAAPANAQNLSEVEARIKELEEQEADLSKAQGYLDDSLRKLNDGSHLVIALKDSPAGAATGISIVPKDAAK